MGEMCLSFEKRFDRGCEKLVDTVTDGVKGEVDLMSAN
jgi:hypothetical protein